MDLVIVNRRFKGKEQNAICHFSFQHQTSDWELKKTHGLYRALALASFTLLVFTQWLLSSYRNKDKRICQPLLKFFLQSYLLLFFLIHFEIKKTGSYYNLKLRIIFLLRKLRSTCLKIPISIPILAKRRHPIHIKITTDSRQFHNNIFR